MEDLNFTPEQEEALCKVFEHVGAQRASCEILALLEKELGVVNIATILIRKHIYNSNSVVMKLADETVKMSEESGLDVILWKRADRNK